MRNIVVNDRAERDRGNILVAMTIILVLCTLGTAMAYRVVGNQAIVVSRQSDTSAISLADAGLADALFRIDQGTAGTGSGSYFCVKSGDSNCIASSIPSAPGTSYVATQISATQWQVEATATVGNQTGAVEETVSRTAQYPFALFGQTALTFNGNTTGGQLPEAFSTYDPTKPFVSTGSSPNPDPNGSVAIGSDGTITCNGGIGTNVQVVYYGSGGVGSTAGKCGQYQTFTNQYYLAPPVTPSGAQSCPNAGQLGSLIPGAPATLAAGTYLCTVPVTMNGVLTVAGPVQLYIMLDPTIYGNTTPALTITPGSFINDQADWCLANSGASACSPAPNLPTATNLEIFSNSTGTFGNANGQGYDLGGIVYAPNASLTGDGCKSSYYGAIVINTLTCNGGPHLYVSYDNQLTTVYGPWTPSGYTQINPSSVSIP